MLLLQLRLPIARSSFLLEANHTDNEIARAQVAPMQIDRPPPKAHNQEANREPTAPNAKLLVTKAVLILLRAPGFKEKSNVWFKMETP